MKAKKNDLEIRMSSNFYYEKIKSAASHHSHFVIGALLLVFDVLLSIVDKQILGSLFGVSLH